MSSQGKRSIIDVAGPWVALCAAVGLTASGEYQLAQLAGWGGIIAALLPTAVDVYVVIAIRAHRDVAGAIIMMIATNALYHLAAANLFGTDGRPGHLAWWLIVAVTAVAPMVMWRIHGIMPRRPQEAEERPSLNAAGRPTAVPQGAPIHAPVAPQTIPQGAPKAAPVAPQQAPQTATPTPAVSPLMPAQGAPKAPGKAPKAAPPKRSGKTARGAAKDAIRDLYDELGRRPLESEMIAVLVRIKSPHTSRQFANKLRGEIEKEHPHLAALGQANVLPMTGTGN